MTNGRRTPNRILAIGAAALAVVVIATVWLVARGDGGGGVTSGPSPSVTQGATTSPAPTTSGAPTASPKPTASRSTASQVPSPSLGTPSAVGKGSTEPVEQVTTKKAVPLDEPADFGTGLTVRLTRIDEVKGEATMPGEIAGPALRVRLEAENDSKSAVSLDSVVVFVSYGEDRTPAVELSKGKKPLTGQLASGKSKTGVYIYTVPEDERDLVRVEVSYSGEAPTVAFEGPVE